MSPEPKIERYEVVTPENIAPDNYENIVVKTTTGTEVKVNKKHAYLHQLFYDACEQRRALKIGYATYMNKEYVHTAELFDGKPPVEKQVEHITAGVKKEQLPKLPSDTMTNEMWAEKQRVERSSIESQVAYKGIVELMVAKIVTKEDEIGKATVDWALARLEPQWKPLPEAIRQVLQQSEKGSDVSTDRDLSAIKNLGDFHKAIQEDFGIYPNESLEILNKEREEKWAIWTKVTEPLEVCYLTIMRSVKDAS